MSNRLRKLFLIYKVLDFQNRIKLFIYAFLTLIVKRTHLNTRRKINIHVSGVSYELRICKGELDIIYQTNILKDYEQKKEFVPKTGDVAIDIGANIGSTSLQWSKTLRNGTIYAVEPNPETFRRLQRHIKINKLSETILPYNFAVAEKNGQIDLYISEYGSMAMMNENIKWKGEIISVPCTTLDRFIEQESLFEIDLLKIDVEGFEVEVLNGAKITLENTRKIIIEYHSKKLRAQCLQILEQNFFETEEFGTLLFGTKRNVLINNE